MKRWLGIKCLNDLPPITISQLPILENKTGSWRTMCPQIEYRIPPCNEACPAGEDIGKVIALVGEGRFQEAWQLIMGENPFPGSCGRVCFHPCETACNRNDFDGNVSVNTIERAIFDHVMRENLIVPPLVTQKRKERVAVVGSGPAGLSCAYHLTLMGYKVTIFETLPVLGGMLRVGIPEYRLPKDVLNREIDTILSLGINVKTNTKLGRDIDLDDLMEFDAVFLAIGAWKKNDVGIEYETHKNTIGGLDLLRKLNLGERVELGKKVVVIGGGNTAIDVARSVLRKKGNPTILYRRSKNEMPAFKEEVTAAEKEGVTIIYLASPQRVHLRNGKGFGLECIRNDLGEEEADGRRKIIPIDGSNFVLETDMIVTATGETPDLSFVDGRLTTKNQSIEVNLFGATTLPRFFAGGDAVVGPRSVANAIGWGKRGAVSIDVYLTKKNPNDIFESIHLGSKEAYSIEGYKKRVEIGNKKAVCFSDLNMEYFEFGEKSKSLFLTAEEMPTSFKEVSKGIPEIEAVEESRRCFNCGVCNSCGNCYLFCPDFSISLSEEEGEPTINYDYCKGCGICVKECPRGVISIAEEKK